jgi:hypothetical protein
MQLLQWFIFGILFTLAVQGFAYLSIKIEMKWWAWATAICGAVAILFGLAWAGASFVEGVSQSGALALIFFCGPGVLLLTWIWRAFVQPQLTTK